MTSYRSRNHTKWAKYHVVFIPKYRKKAIYADLRRYLGDVCAAWPSGARARWKKGIDARRPCSPHVVDSPEVLGGGCDRLHQGGCDPHRSKLRGAAAQFRGADVHFWARGYFVSTVGRDEQAIRAYIQDQEREDQRLEQLRFDSGSHP